MGRRKAPSAHGCAEGDLAGFSDLSTAFDTVRHDILLDRLRSRLGVTDQALNWFTSYLSGRTQRVSFNGGMSDTFPLARKGHALARFCSRYMPANYSI